MMIVVVEIEFVAGIVLFDEIVFVTFSSHQSLTLVFVGGVVVVVFADN